MVPGAGHWLMEESPQVAKRAIAVKLICFLSPVWALELTLRYRRC